LISKTLGPMQDSSPGAIC